MKRRKYLAVAWIVCSLLGAGEGRSGSGPAPAVDTGALVAFSGDSPTRLSLPPGFQVNSLAKVRAGWLVAGTRPAGAGTEVVLHASDQGQGPFPPSPPRGDAPLQTEPVLLVRGGELAGLAWLEGDRPRGLAVRFASWTGIGWEEPQTVSPPGPGSQLALTGVGLRDGSLLLAWSAFDGEDDDIVWSLFRDGAWTPPRRVGADNRVPDMTPALVASPSGALLAWSRYDGRHYRLQVARWQEESWSEATTVGPPGSLFPSFHPLEGGLYLLHRVAWPRAWSLLELTPSGAIHRHGEIRAETGERPVLIEATDREAALLWPTSGKRVRIPWTADR